MAVVRVRIGRLRQLVPEYMSLYFEVAAMDSLCKGASFEWERVPSVLRCSDCGEEWNPAPPPAHDGDELVLRFRCPRCGGPRHEVVSGDELMVESIDVTEPAMGGS